MEHRGKFSIDADHAELATNQFVSVTITADTLGAVIAGINSFCKERSVTYLDCDFYTDGRIAFDGKTRSGVEVYVGVRLERRRKLYPYEVKTLIEECEVLRRLMHGRNIHDELRRYPHTSGQHARLIRLRILA